MAHAFSAVYVHLVFSTKDRRPFLTDEGVRHDLYRYLAGIASQHDAPALIVGGVEDHVHLLLRLGRTVSLADLVRELKRGSSMWIKPKGAAYRGFAWQSGYAALSVSPRELDGVRAYIAGQVEHHRRDSFQDEYCRLLLESGIELDERYMWE